MSVRDEEGYVPMQQIPYCTAEDALRAGSSEERRRILKLLQSQQAARAKELEKVMHATLHPHQPSWIKQQRPAFGGA